MAVAGWLRDKQKCQWLRGNVPNLMSESRRDLDRFIAVQNLYFAIDFHGRFTGEDKKHCRGLLCACRASAVPGGIRS
jgi:hypothetical protein